MAKILYMNLLCLQLAEGRESVVSLRVYKKFWDDCTEVFVAGEAPVNRTGAKLSSSFDGFLTN